MTTKEKEFDWADVREAFKLASTEKSTKEVPKILEAVNWEGLNFVEISRYGDARIPIALNGIYRRATILIQNKDLIKEVREKVLRAGLSYGPGCKINCRTFSLEDVESDEKFDLVFAEWPSHTLVEDERFMRLVNKLSNRYLMLVMPSPDSYDSLLSEMAKKGEIKRRKALRATLIQRLRDNNWEAKFKKFPLDLHFKDEDTARKVYYKVLFNNEPTLEQKRQVDAFLNKERTKSFDDSFYILTARKK